MKTWILLVFALVLAACSASSSRPAPSSPEETPTVNQPKSDASAPSMSTGATKDALAGVRGAPTEVATFATGCYWCTEAVFQRLPGVVSVRSGFTGGTVANPTYEQCCSGTTGHAEAVEVTFDPAKIAYETLLDWFWRMHDPTTLNRQGADVGTQYRSAIFWHTEAQRAAAEKSKQEAQGAFRDPIVTEIAKAGPFYAADAGHQDYFNQHASQGYCRAVIAPKLHKLGLDASSKDAAK
jgi:peptide-methionine (S)-S-oxide reductase